MVCKFSVKIHCILSLLDDFTLSRSWLKKTLEKQLRFVWHSITGWLKHLVTCTYKTVTGTSILPNLLIPILTFPSFSNTAQDDAVNSTTLLEPPSLRSIKFRLAVEWISVNICDCFTLTFSYNWNKGSYGNILGGNDMIPASYTTIILTWIYLSAIIWEMLVSIS